MLVDVDRMGITFLKIFSIEFTVLAAVILALLFL